jgi:hypothetical protein
MLIVPTLHTYRIYSGLVYLVLSTGKSKTISPPESEDSVIYHTNNSIKCTDLCTRLQGMLKNQGKNTSKGSTPHPKQNPRMKLGTYFHRSYWISMLQFFISKHITRTPLILFLQQHTHSFIKSSVTSQPTSS